MSDSVVKVGKNGVFDAGKRVLKGALHRVSRFFRKKIAGHKVAGGDKPQYFPGVGVAIVTTAIVTAAKASGDGGGGTG